MLNIRKFIFRDSVSETYYFDKKQKLLLMMLIVV